jgi:hypothetical protein
MPKKTKKKTSLKQKQKVKVIVNVNNKTTRRRRYAPRQPKQPQQPQQIIIQQPSMISRELPMPMFNPIQQASAPPVFQGVGQMLQPPNELLRSIYREEPDFENYSQRPYMETTLQAPQFEEPAEIQREVASVSSSSSIFSPQSSFDEKLQQRIESRFSNRPLIPSSVQMVDVNAPNKGFDEPVPQDIPLPEMIKPKRGVYFSEDEQSIQPTLNLTKPDPKIIQNIQQGEETDASIATTTTKMPKKRKPRQPKGKLKLSDEEEIEEPIVVVPAPPPLGLGVRRGRPKQTPPAINEGKVESAIYSKIMNLTKDSVKDAKSLPMKELNNLLAGVGIDPQNFSYRGQKEKRLLQYRDEIFKNNR